MTRAEAKAILENDIVDGHVKGNSKFMDAFWMAVDALEFDDTKYHAEHGEVIVAKEVWEDAEKALKAIEDAKAEIRQKQWHIGVDSANDVIEIINKHMFGISKGRR